MAFDLKKFKSAKLGPRQAAVPVPGLKLWFGEDEEPTFLVRGLTGEELAMVNQAVLRNSGREAIVEALTKAVSKDMGEAVREAVGLGDGLPNDFVRRVEAAVLGMVEPALELDMVVRMFKLFPIDAYAVSNKIFSLTAGGAEPGE